MKKVLLLCDEINANMKNIKYCTPNYRCLLALAIFFWSALFLYVSQS